jgi:predicted nucleotidyltransferase
VSIDLAPDDVAIVTCLEQAVSDLVAVYRFGSTVYGLPHAESDVDVAVLASRPVPLETWFATVERLAETLEREVDLLDLRLASPVLSLQVITRGRVLFERDGVARVGFEGRVLGEYARLNEQRRGILDRIALEGTVYGR